MGSIEFIPVWVIEDVIVFVAALIMTVYIVKNEKHPASVLIEFFCFVFLYAAVYENFATMMKWYAYGPSAVMIFNVPLSVPVVEYLIVYASLKLLDATRVPVWTKPLITGFFAVLSDFALDPVSVKQVFATSTGMAARWAWFPGAADAQILGEPVYNFTGWMLICGFAAAMLLLGRWWHRKTNYNKAVGYLYPVLAMLAALLVLVSPLSSFLLWLGPIFQKGSFAEWVMLALALTLPSVQLAALWRGRMTAALSARRDYPLALVLMGLPIIDVVFCAAGGYWQALCLVLPAAAALSVITMAIFRRGSKHSTAQGF